MARHVEAVEHSALGKVGHMTGRGATRGFGVGVLGAITGTALATGLVGGLAYGAYALGSLAALSVGGVAAGVGAAVLGAAAVGALFTVALPTIAVATGVGLGFGVFSGARSANKQVNLEQAAANYNRGYEQQVSQVQAQMMQASAQPNAYTEVPTASNENVPSNQISAATIEHQQQLSAAAEQTAAR